MAIANVNAKWESGDLVFYNTAGTELLRFDESAGTVTINESAVAIGTQASLISDLGGSATGAEIATAVNAIIDALQAFGIVATS